MAARLHSRESLCLCGASFRSVGGNRARFLERALASSSFAPHATHDRLVVEAALFFGYFRRDPAGVAPWLATMRADATTDAATALRLPRM